MYIKTKTVRSFLRKNHKRPPKAGTYKCIHVFLTPGNITLCHFETYQLHECNLERARRNFENPVEHLM